MNGGPSGFNNAPITRAFVISCAIFTIVFGIQGRSNKLGFSYQDIFKKLQLWKLVVSVFAFASTPELMFGSYLLYYFRVFERQIGSNKHSVFILFSLVMSSLLEVLVLALLNDPSLNLLASGPYGLIFSAFVPFFLDIPVSTRFRVFSLHFPDKSFIYLAGIQLLLSSWKRSIIPGICGILAGTLYRLNIFCIRRMKVLSSPSFSFEKSDLLKINRNRWQNSDKPAKNPYHMTKAIHSSTLNPSKRGFETLLPNTDAGQFLEKNNNYKTMEKNSDETPHLTTPSIFYSGDALHTTTPRVSQPPKRGKSS